MLYMVIEKYKDKEAVYKRFHEKGRMMPEGVSYVNSWVSEDGNTCYQINEAESEELLHEWASNWNDVTEFEFIPVISSQEMSNKMAGNKKTNEIWDVLYQEAMKVLKPREVSEMLETGGVAAAIESISGKIYTGICVDGACTLGICAERNAIFNMLTNGEDAMKRVVAVNWDGKVLAPCGACRELMTQLMPDNYKEIEVMLDYEKKRVVTLGELTPEWWI